MAAMQRFTPDGFAQVGAAASGQAELDVVVVGMGRQGDHRDRRAAQAGLEGTQCTGGLMAVQDGHLHIHQHQVEVLGGQQLQRVFAIGGHRQGQVLALQHGLHQQDVDLVVLGNQHPPGA